MPRATVFAELFRGAEGAPSDGFFPFGEFDLSTRDGMKKADLFAALHARVTAWNVNVEAAVYLTSTEDDSFNASVSGDFSYESEFVTLLPDVDAVGSGELNLAVPSRVLLPVPRVGDWVVDPIPLPSEWTKTDGLGTVSTGPYLGQCDWEIFTRVLDPLTLGNGHLKNGDLRFCRFNFRLWLITEPAGDFHGASDFLVTTVRTLGAPIVGTLIVRLPDFVEGEGFVEIEASLYSLIALSAGTDTRSCNIVLTPKFCHSFEGVWDDDSNALLNPLAPED